MMVTPLVATEEGLPAFSPTLVDYSRRWRMPLRALGWSEAAAVPGVPRVGEELAAGVGAQRPN